MERYAVYKWPATPSSYSSTHSLASSLAGISASISGTGYYGNSQLAINFDKKGAGNFSVWHWTWRMHLRRFVPEIAPTKLCIPKSYGSANMSGIQ